MNGPEENKQQNQLDEFSKRLQRTNEMRLRIIELNVLSITANLITMQTGVFKHVLFLLPSIFWSFSAYSLLIAMFPTFPFNLLSNRYLTEKEITQKFEKEEKEGKGIRLYLFEAIDHAALVLTIIGLILFVLIIAAPVQCLMTPTSDVCRLLPTTG